MGDRFKRIISRYVMKPTRSCIPSGSLSGALALICWGKGLKVGMSTLPDGR